MHATSAIGAPDPDLLAVEVVVAQTEAAVPEPLPEPYTSLFKQAKEAPTEFNTWTSLITAAEKLVRGCAECAPFKYHCPPENLLLSLLV